MNWKINIIGILFLVLIACREQKQPQQIEPEIVSEPVLISSEEIPDLLASKDFLWIDARSEKSYSEGHIAGAANISRKHIEDTTFPYGGMMASQEATEALLGKIGYREGQKILLYDSGGSSESCRLWWILSQYGIKNIHILDGGWVSYVNGGNPVSVDTVAFQPSEIQLKYADTGLRIHKDALAALINNPRSSALIIDSRSHDEYTGKRLKKGAKRAGHIPGSIHLDYARAFDHAGNRKFWATGDLEKIYGNLADKETDTIIVYCHSGVRSSHTTFVLRELMGYKNVMNYDGSWLEWSYYDELPVTQDSVTRIIN